MTRIKTRAALGAVSAMSVAWIFSAGGCSGSSTSNTSDASTDTSPQKDSSTKTDSAPDSGTDSSSGKDTSTTDTATDTANDSPAKETGTDAGCIDLKVINYKKWCSVTVNGGTASTDETQTACVASGTSVDLTAAPASTKFELGTDPWHDTTTADEAKGTATITVTKTDDCVWVCCPFTGGTGCPTKDQCP
jgi:hypothetical protein